MTTESNPQAALPAGVGGATEVGSGPGTPRLTPHAGWLLAVCCLAQFMVILDLSIVNVALPSIQFSLTFTASDLQWVVDAYAIAFAGFLMLGGRAADHFGQRRTFVAALVVFATASLIGGAAGTRQMLIAARALQGVGAALMAASSLAILTSSFPAGPARHRAIGLWGAMNGAGGAAGTLLGGLITQELSWRWVLLINPPIGAAAVAIALIVVRDRGASGSRRGFDLAGALSLTVGQMVLVYGVVEASVFGWHSWRALVPIAAGVVILAAFGVIETRSSSPLVPFREITRPLATANGVVLLFSAALFPMWFVGSLYLQQVLGLSPLHTGLTFLPMALTIMVCARQAGRLVSRFGVQAVLGGGLVMMSVGMLLFARIQPSGSAIAYILVPGVLTAAGIGLSIVPSTIAATQGAKQGQAGLASGLVNTSRQIGGGLGLAVLITLATQVTTHAIGHNHGVPEALTQGFRLAYFICAGLCATAAVVTFAAIAPAAKSQRPPLRMLGAVGLLVVAFAVGDLAFAGGRGAPIGAYTTRGAYTFVSAPGLHPPRLHLTATGPGARAPGYVLLANFYDLTQHPMVGQSGPLLVDNSLQPVWFRPLPPSLVAGNLSLQTYHGRPALAWWQGVITSTGATETGEDVVVDQHYRTVATLRAAGGWVITLHDLVIDGDDAWVTANRNLPMDLSRFGGAYNGALIDSAVQEYSLSTGRLLRSWDALGHIPLSDSYASLPTNGFPWDAYHVNSVQLTGDGSFVVSMRNTWAAYRVDIASGRVVWALGGRHSSFRIGPDADFQWQHDVEVHAGSQVSMFDDHCCQITGGGTYVSPTGLSRGLLLHLSQSTGTATVTGQVTRADEADAEYMGNAEQLPGGGLLVGWGSVPSYSEYSPTGKLLFDAALPRPDLSYRAILAPWVGLPDTPPAGAARRTGGASTVYASWNGATEVRGWRVLAGQAGGSLTRVATARRSGFETAIPVRPGYGSFEVEALSADGRVIGTSRRFGIGSTS